MARNWAITIGVNGYRYLQRLHYAKQDADAVRQFFTQELGFAQVYHFTEDSPPIPQDYGPDLDSHPNYTTLDRFFRTRFEHPFLREGDNLWCFFAGHGIRDQNRDYLMPIDGDRGNLERSALPIHYISERLRRSGADNVILLIDACRSYEGRREGVGIGQEKQQGVITLFSCSPEESSYEIQEIQHGAFTYVLIESLRLQGEGNCATVERLYQRLRYYVPQLTRQYKRVDQTPYGVIEPPSKNHFILLPHQATLADVEALKKDALKAEVGHDAKTAKQLWIRVLAASPADPEAIEGIERLPRIGVSPLPVTPPVSPPQRTEPQPPSSPVTPRAATPAQPHAASPAKQGDSIAPQKRSAQTKHPSPPVTPVAKPSTKTRKPRKAKPFPQRSDSPLPTRTPSGSFLGDRISRRRAVQILGFGGGGIGVVLLGKALFQPTSDTPEPVSKPSSLPPREAEPVINSSPLTAKDFTAFNFEVVTVDQKGEIIKQETKQSYIFQESVEDVVLELVPVPSGKFMMGSPESEVGRDDDEGPQYEVNIQPLLMGKYPVTQAQWQAVAANLAQVGRELNSDPSHFKGGDLPVERVSWDDAEEFCKRLSKHAGREYRLPTEAEWEYACRARTTTPFHFGETLTTDLANYNGNLTYGEGPKGEYLKQTTPVGSFQFANAFSLYDMHGNVWEWCLDHWHDNYDGAPPDGTAWLSPDDNAPRLLRGGSWHNNPDNCRSANRDRRARAYRPVTVGFRVVCASSWTL